METKTRTLPKLDVSCILKRPNSFKAQDESCIKAIAQAAINVELFTIPLYMTSLYSIQGTHQILSKDSDLYEGRWWPGMGPTAGPISGSGQNTQFDTSKLTTNEKVFNNVYSVFIEEMLHLQLASNMASKIGVTPIFTSEALQTPNYGWKCYAPDNTTIPHILDFQDCNPTLKDVNPVLKQYFETHYPGKTLQDIKVKLDAMNGVQSLLFLAIEETEEDAHEVIQEKYWNPDKLDPSLDGRPKYFENAPFDWWQADYTEENLPLFGSIGHMYRCYWSYLEIVYEDGTTLLGNLLNKDSEQRDYFNGNCDPDDATCKAKEQYPGIDGSLSNEDDFTKLKIQLINNINAITDQGEGGGVVDSILETWKETTWAQQFLAQKNSLQSVQAKYQPSVEGLMNKYPAYDDKGLPIPNGISGSAFARLSNKAKDHFETFAECLDLIIANTDLPKGDKNRYVTWDVWYQENPNSPWKDTMLNPENTASKYPALPKANEVAKALNNLCDPAERQQTHDTFSVSAVGTLKGLTTALNSYWANPKAQFPSPAMGGSGDRVSICWATTGVVPNLVKGIDAPDASKLYNACQGMSYMNPQEPESTMPDTLTYHSCKGSNSCMAQGGCGFVQSDKGGGQCGGSQCSSVEVNAGCGLPDIKSAPANNKCNTYGGCAVPISASQLYPDQKDNNTTNPPTMQLYKFFKDGDKYSFTQEKKLLEFDKGDSVYDTAWKAYCISTGKEGNLKIDAQQIGDQEIIKAQITNKPMATDIRLALPPST